MAVTMQVLYSKDMITKLKLNFINTERLFSKKRKEPFLSFFKVLGFYPRNIDYYLLAVRHKSISIQGTDGKLLNNERLEFLGDAVLNSIISDILYHRYPDEQEGFLTNARSNIVKRDTLNDLCMQIGLDRLLITIPHLTPDKSNNIYGNALEALIGAIYLDYGYLKCAEFIKERLFENFDILKQTAEENDNYKSGLLEWAQKNRLETEFRLQTETVNADNQHTFHTRLLIEGINISEGTKYFYQTTVNINKNINSILSVKPLKFSVFSGLRYHFSNLNTKSDTHKTKTYESKTFITPDWHTSTEIR